MANAVTQSLRLLHLEEDPDVSRRVQSVLESDGLQCTLDRVVHEDDYRDALTSGCVDLILADLELSTRTNPDALTLRARIAPTTPLILVTDSRGELSALDALKHGATDVVLEESLARLPSAVRRAMAESRQARERLAAEDAHRAHLRFFENLDRINRAIQGTDDVEQMMSDVLETMLSILSCDRAWLILPCDAHAPSWRVMMERTRPEHPSVVGIGVEVAMTPDAAEILRMANVTDGALRFDPQSESPLPENVARSYDARSMLVMALTPKTGARWLLGLHQCSYARVWTPEDERLFVEAGRRLTDGLTTLTTMHGEREANARVGEILESITEAFVAMDRDWRYTYVNDLAAKTIGETREALLGQHVWNRKNPMTGTEVQAHLERAMSDRVPVHFECLVQTTGRWFESHVFPTKEGLSVYTTDITERRRVEESLRTRERESVALLENAPDLICRFDLECRFMYVNRAIEKSLGAPMSALLGKTPTEIVHNDAPSAVYEARVRDVFASGVPLEFELDQMPPDGGASVCSLIRLSPELDDADRIVSVLSISRDVTALKETERQFRTLTEHSTDIICRFDREARYLYANGAVETITDAPVEALLGTRFGDVLDVPTGVEPSPDILAIREGIEQVFASGFARELEVRLPLRLGERFFDVRLVPECNLSDQVTSVLHTARDITERRRTEEVLIWRTAFFEAQVESAIDGIVVVDSLGNKVVQNERMSEMWKIPRKMVEERDDSAQLDYVTGRTKNPAAFAARVEYLYAHPDEVGQDEVELDDGTILERYSSPVRDRNGRHFGRIWTFRDITARRKLEEQYRQAQKMEAIGQLAGGIAHDFNNLLSVIQMQSSMLLPVPSSETETREGIQEIMAAAERAANLTRQLLTFSRRNVSEARDMDLAEVTGNMSRLFRRLLGDDIALETRFAPALPWVSADAGMMEQVLMNLAVNARDAMPNGGRMIVSLELANVDARDVAGRPGARPGRFVCLGVSDTGCGMSVENLSHIFEPFFTTKEVGKGTGLGLASVFGIVEQHDGWIDVASEEGRGTTFRVYLPALDQEAERSSIATADQRVRGGTETILVVEDEPSVRGVVCAVLERHGYRVLEAGSAAAALVRWEERTEPIDLLLTDLVMPGGMSGAELGQALLARQSDLRIIYTSGYSHDVVTRQLDLAPGRNFLQKPCSMHELAATVRRRLDEA
ncbi:MAG: PAS domain-containing protein [Gemmatimonadaceae bacterium]